MPPSADAPDPGGWTRLAAGAATTGPTGGGVPLTPDLTADDCFRDALAAALAPALALERELAGGGMARVFVAVEVALGRRVVVKVLPPDLAAGINKERFRREIQLAAQLQHPYIVPLLSAGEVAAAGDGPTAAAAGSLYYTMPFIEGESLRAEAAARAARGAAFTAREVQRILHDVADALGYAHARGVVHRDVKPGNVLLLHGHALVTDFGVAKALASSVPASPVATMTTLGMAIGTPAYMAPEQLAADPAADHRMDLYAAGLVAYELLTGASPFAAASPQATLAAQLTREPAPLAEVRPDVPPALAAAVMRCLAKDPAGRPASAAALLMMLDAVGEASTPDATPAVAATARTATAGPTTVRTAAGAVGGDTTAVAPAVTRPPAAAPPAGVGAVLRRPLVAVGLALAAGATLWAARGGAGSAGWPVAESATATAAAGPARAAVAAPTLTRADSVAIAAAVAREFERALARRTPDAATPGQAAAPAAGGGSPAGTVAGVARVAGTPKVEAVPRPPAPPAPPAEAAALHRAARDRVADSLVRAEHWGKYSHDVVRAVVGRLPVGFPALPPEARAEVDAALRELPGHIVDADARAAAARAGETRAEPQVDGVRARPRFHAFEQMAAALAPPAPGARRVAVVMLQDGTGRRELAGLAPVLEAGLRTQLRALGPYEFTDQGVGALARRERVPDALVARATGAGAVLRGTVHVAGEKAKAILLVYDARRGRPVAVRADAPVAASATMPELAEALAAPLARAVAAALDDVAWDGGRKAP